MTRSLKLLLLLAGCISFSASAYAEPQPAIALTDFAQGPGYGPSYGPGGMKLTCSSNDGRRNYCSADTRNGVRLSRQISGSACIQGQTWGYDKRGVWVDRGCRAEFFVMGAPPHPPAQKITCSSNDGRRNYCSVNGRDIRLTRQISGSPCIQGQTWGYDKHGVWVDRGCRAEFSVR
jgi:Protein of unknown function (DUF3011)